LLST
jgi:hypothetical protein